MREKAVENLAMGREENIENNIKLIEKKFGGGSIPLPAAAFSVLRHPLQGSPLDS
jgi:hypothetical protein